MPDASARYQASGILYRTNDPGKVKKRLHPDTAGPPYGAGGASQ